MADTINYIEQSILLARMFGHTCPLLHILRVCHQTNFPSTKLDRRQRSFRCSCWVIRVLGDLIVLVAIPASFIRPYGSEYDS